MILPAFGIVSHIISTFSKKPVFGYLGMALPWWRSGYWLYCLGAPHVHGGLDVDTRACYPGDGDRGADGGKDLFHGLLLCGAGQSLVFRCCGPSALFSCLLSVG